LILTPKRKLIGGTAQDEFTETIIEHTKETVIDEISYGYRSVNAKGEFGSWLKIPVGTNKYPNPP